MSDWIGNMSIKIGAHTAGLASGLASGVGMLQGFASRVDGLTTGITNTLGGLIGGSSFGGIASSILGTLGPMGVMGTAALGLGVAMKSWVTAGMDSIAAQGKIQKEFGMSAESAGGLQHALALTGGSMEESGPALMKLNRLWGDLKSGSHEAISKFRQAGIDTDKLSDKTTNFNDVLGMVSDRYRSLDEAGRASMGFELMGRQFMGATKVLRMGSAGLAMAGQEGLMLGTTDSAANVAKVMEARKAMAAAEARFGAIGQNVQQTLAVAVAEPLMKAADLFGATMVAYGPVIGKTLGTAFSVMIDATVSLVEGFAWILEKANEVGKKATPGALTFGANALTNYIGASGRAGLNAIMGDNWTTNMAGEMVRGSRETQTQNDPNSIASIMARLRGMRSSMGGGGHANEEFGARAARAGEEAEKYLDTLRDQRYQMTSTTDEMKLHKLQQDGATTAVLDRVRAQIESNRLQQQQNDDLKEATTISRANFSAAEQFAGSMIDTTRLLNSGMLGGQDAALKAFKDGQALLDLGKQSAGVSGPSLANAGSQAAISAINRFGREGNQDIGEIMREGQRVSQEMQQREIEIGEAMLAEFKRLQPTE